MNKDILYLPRQAIQEAARIYPTPFFLYDEGKLRGNCRRLADAFLHHFPDFDPLFAVKANANPEILRIIQSEGFGFDCSSLSEAWLAGELGARGMYTGNYTIESEFRMAMKAGLTINLDDISMIPAVARLGFPLEISFRVNPGLGKGGMDSLVLAGPDAKYGIPHEQASRAYAMARDAGAVRFGMHMMTGSNVLDERYFALVVQMQLDIAAKIKRDTGIDIEFMNIGGGFGVPYRPDESTLDLRRTASGIARIVDSRCKKLALHRPILMAEPGRYIGASAGWLVSRVQVIKDSYKKYVGIDASANDMPRPSIYGAYHHVTVLNHCRELETVSIVGRVCENSDQFARDRLLPRCRVGDLVAIHNCGAHAYAMGHNYNGHLRGAEVLRRLDGSFQLIRRAESLQDLFATVSDVIPIG
jgi:diaminopimelate decarboxylase